MSKLFWQEKISKSEYTYDFSKRNTTQMITPYYHVISAVGIIKNIKLNRGFHDNSQRSGCYQKMTKHLFTKQLNKPG